jgi:hypothetical protein
MPWLLLQLALLATDPVHGTEFAQTALKNSAVIEQRQKAEVAFRQEAEFRRRFNQLLDAIAAFSDQYNKGGGHVWPSKQAQNLYKALRELEAVDPLKNAR